MVAVGHSGRGRAHSGAYSGQLGSVLLGVLLRAQLRAAADGRGSTKLGDSIVSYEILVLLLPAVGS